MTTSPMFPCQIAWQGTNFPCQPVPVNHLCGCGEPFSGPKMIFSRVSPRGREIRLSRGADCDFLDFAADERLVCAEIGFEALRQAPCGLVIGLLVGPSAARVEHLVRHLGAAFRHEEAEIRLLADR